MCYFIMKIHAMHDKEKITANRGRKRREKQIRRKRAGPKESDLLAIFYCCYIIFISLLLLIRTVNEYDACGIIANLLVSGTFKPEERNDEIHSLT